MQCAFFQTAAVVRRAAAPPPPPPKRARHTHHCCVRAFLGPRAAEPSVCKGLMFKESVRVSALRAQETKLACICTRSPTQQKRAPALPAPLVLAAHEGLLVGVCGESNGPRLSAGNGVPTALR